MQYPTIRPLIHSDPSPNAELTSDLPRIPIVCICAGMLIYFVQVTALFPVLPLYLTQRWGSDAPVGWVVGAMAVGLLGCRPLIGILLDRWGRKPMLWLGLGVMIGILPLYLWASDPTQLIGVRFLHGLSQAAFATASHTLMADWVPPQRRTAMLGYLAMSNTLGFALGPALGSVLFGWGGWLWVIGLMAGLTVLGVGLSFGLPKSPAVRVSPVSEKGSSDPAWAIALRFPVREATLIFFVGSFLHGGVVTFLPLLLDHSAPFLSLNALMAVFVRFGLGRWGHRFSHRWTIPLGMACSGGALLGLAFFPGQQLWWAVVYGLGFGALFPILSAIVSLSVPADRRGRVYSLFLAGFDLGMTLGGAGIQLLLGVWSLPMIFALWGGLGCMTGAWAIRPFRRAIPQVPLA